MRNHMLTLIVVVFVTVVMLGCTNSSDAQRALQSSGYTDIKTGGYGWLACGKDDFYSTKFVAKNSNGQQVSGVVCSGFFLKGATVRF